MAPSGVERVATLPFDHDRQLSSVLVREPRRGCELVVKGAPEAVLSPCAGVDPEARAVLDGLFSRGSRVVAVATRSAVGQTTLTPEDERDLRLAGFLTFVDRPKPDAADAIGRLGRLGVEVKVITGDNDVVANKVCADIVLLDKDLGILADGIAEGRRTFANTIKYVLMGTSSNFGNMFSAGAASLFLNFLPMLPTQILLNNLLYDISEMTLPTDNVDEEQLRRPADWDIRMIRRFMLFFGPISSIFDFATFAIMLGVFDAGASLFRSGWFVESLATQSLIVFAIRTRRAPFFRSRASRPLTITTLGCVAIGAALPFSPLAGILGFTALPAAFFAFLVAMVLVYIVLIELGKRRFYRHPPEGQPLARAHPRRRIHHRASRLSTRGDIAQSA